MNITYCVTPQNNPDYSNVIPTSCARATFNYSKPLVKKT